MFVPNYRVEDFLITDPILVHKLTEEAAGIGQSMEALLIRQSKDNLDLSLYLNQELLDTIGV